MAGTATEIEVDRRLLRLTNLDKVLYPTQRFTKGQVIDYYAHVAPALLAHLARRPLTLKRYPDGVSDEFFYEKQCPRHRPAWVPVIEVPSERSGLIRYCAVDDLSTLMWLANLATLELHPLLWRAPELDRPTAIVFDLDPGPPASVLEAGKVALLLRRRLESTGMQPLVKTSGGKGLHVVLPLPGEASFDTTKDFARLVARELEAEHPEQVVSSMRKELRRGKVFVDWSQNDRHKTTVAAYSLRAGTEPTVSTPITWEEFQAALDSGDPRRFLYGPRDVVRRLERFGDLHAAATGRNR